MTQVIDPTSDSSDKGSNRRGFIKAGTSLAAAAGLTSALARSVHSAEDNKIRVALIGCGGRGIEAIVPKGRTLSVAFVGRDFKAKDGTGEGIINHHSRHNTNRSR